MWFIDNESSEGKDPHLIDLSEFWGSNYFFDTVDGQPVKNFFIHEVEKHARYAIPFVKNIMRLVSRRT